MTLPSAAADYVQSFAGLYFEAMNEWFALLKPGTRRGKIVATDSRPAAV